MKAFLLLGTNLGDRLNNLELAKMKICESVSPLTQISAVYETAAWGFEEQPSFFNQAISLHTKLAPQALLSVLKTIEQEMGRTTSRIWGPRLIDIDILLLDDLIFYFPELTIPHPRLHQRRFTLLPLTEIAPTLQHPVFKCSISDLLKQCDDNLEVKVFQNQKTSIQ